MSEDIKLDIRIFAPLIEKGMRYYPVQRGESQINGHGLIVIGDGLRVKGTRCLIIGDQTQFMSSNHFFAGKHIRKTKGELVEVTNVLGESLTSPANLTHIVSEVLQKWEKLTDITTAPKDTLAKKEKKNLDRVRAMTQFVKAPECVVCMEKLACVALYPCTHVIFCQSCTLIIAENEDATCAICRSPITKFIPLIASSS